MSGLGTPRMEASAEARNRTGVSEVAVLHKTIGATVLTLVTIDVGFACTSAKLC